GFTGFFQSWTDLGKSKWYLWPSGIGAIICSLLVRQKSLAQRVRKRAAQIGDFLLFLFLCVAVSGIVTDIIKPILGRARPVELQDHNAYGFSPSLLPRGGTPCPPAMRPPLSRWPWFWQLLTHDCACRLLFWPPCSRSAAWW